MDAYINRMKGVINKVINLKIEKLEKEKQVLHDNINNPQSIYQFQIINAEINNKQEKYINEYMKIKAEVKEYRSKVWIDIVNSAKLVIEERERIIVNEIE